MIAALDSLIAEFGLLAVTAAFAVMMLGGFTKGAVGFALPMIAISGIGSLMSADVAVAAMILPGLATNFWQSLRNGIGGALESLRKFWLLCVVLAVTIYFFAQFVVLISDRAFFLLIGTVVTLLATVLILGVRLRFAPRFQGFVEAGIGLLAGFFGALAGVWGPPILLYLTSMDTPKVEQVRVLGISFLIGSVVLTAAHLRSGLLDAVTLPFSAMLIVPGVVGMAVGILLQDRLDQAMFRKATLLVLILAGLNLLRRGVLG